jgi:hypothetical protein
MPLEVSFQNLDPQLGAIVIGAEITRLGTIIFGAIVIGAEITGVNTDVTVMWQSS